MVTHSSILAWRAPWTEESMGSQKIRHNVARLYAQLHAISCTVNIHLQVLRIAWLCLPSLGLIQVL